MKFIRNYKNDIKVKTLYVAKCIIVSSHYDGEGRGPKYAVYYFVVRKIRNQYYEVFSGKKIEMKEYPEKDGGSCKKFNTPYIEEIKPLTSYLKDSKKEVVSSVELFDFITDMNVSEFIGVFNEKDC